MRSITERNELVEKNTGLVIFCVKKMNFGEYDEDLFQIGCIGLIRAAELYDETLGLKFSTYAVNGIKQSLMNELFKKRPKIKENEISGDTPIGKGDITIFDAIGDDSDFTEDLTEKMTYEHITNRVVSMLPERERQIFELTKDGKTQREIAEIFNISQSYVLRIIKKIIRAFKNKRILEQYAAKKRAEDKRENNADRVRKLMTQKQRTRKSEAT